jgi:hypothetical protein
VSTVDITVGLIFKRVGEPAVVPVIVPIVAVEG